MLIIYIDTLWCSLSPFDFFNPKKPNLDNLLDDSPIGHYLEVDLDFPDEVHDLHNDYTLGAEKKLTKEILSEYQSEII